MFLVTKANNDELHCPKVWIFLLCEYHFVLKWRILFEKRIKARSNDQNYWMNLILSQIISMFQVRAPLFLEIKWLCHVVWPLLCQKKKKELHSLSFCPRVRYCFCFEFFLILNLSLIILLFGVYLCNKFINEMWTGRTMCTNSNIVIKYEYNFMSPSHTGLCFIMWLDFNELVKLITHFKQLIQTVLYATQCSVKL